MKWFLALLPLFALLLTPQQASAEPKDYTVKEFIEWSRLLSQAIRADHEKKTPPADTAKLGYLKNYFDGIHRTLRFVIDPEVIDFKKAEREGLVFENVAKKLEGYPRIQDLPAAAFIISVYFAEWGKTPEIMEKGKAYLEKSDGAP